MSRTASSAQLLFLVLTLGVAAVGIRTAFLSTDLIVAEYLLISSSLLLVSAVLVGIWRGLAEHVVFSNTLIQGALATVLSYWVSTSSVATILFLSSLALIPACLRILDASFQRGVSWTCGAACLIAAYPGGLGTMLLAVAASIFTVVATRDDILVRFLGPKDTQEQDKEEQEESILESTWPQVLLQAGLLLVLTLHHWAEAGAILTRAGSLLLLALVWLLLGATLMTMVRQRFQAQLVVFNTSTIALLVCLFSLESGASESASLMTLCLVLFGFSTSNLPWSDRRQDVVAWSLSILGAGTLALFCLKENEAIHRLLSATLVRYPGELLFLLAGLTLSSLTVRLLRSHRIRAEGRKQQKISEQARNDFISLLGGPALSGVSLPTDVLQARIREASLTALIALNLVGAGSVLLLSSDFAYLSAAAVFVALSFAVTRLSEHFSFGASALWVSSSFIALAPVVLVALPALTQTQIDLSAALLPLVLILLSGFVMLPAAYFAPVLVCYGAISYEVYRIHNLGGLTLVVLSVCLLSAFGLSLLSRRFIREDFIMNNLGMALPRLRTREAVAACAAQHLAALIESNISYVNKGKSEWLILEGEAYRSNCRSIIKERSLTKKLLYLDPQLSIERFQLHPGWYQVAPLIPKRFLREAIVVELKSGSRALGKEQPNIEIGLLLSRIPRTLFVTHEISRIRLIVSSIFLRLQALRERERGDAAESVREEKRAEYEYELSTLVHDLNNTIQDITMVCEDNIRALKGNDKEATTSFAFKRIASVARSMATLVSDSRRKREMEGMLRLRPTENVSVTLLAQELEQYALVRGERKRIELAFSIDMSMESWVRVSAKEHLELVLRSLLEHAISSSPAGGTVHCSFVSQENWVRFEVRDDGPGYSKQEIAAQTKLVRGIHGPLAQATWFAEQQGGVFEVRSAGAGLGATYELALPETGVPQSIQSNEDWILIVEDQLALARVYEKLVRVLHFKPIVCSSLAEVRERIDSSRAPRMILSDLHLGDGSGLEVPKIVEAQFKQSPPMLLITGEGIDTPNLGTSECEVVQKPVSQRDLFAAMKRMLNID